MRLNILPVCREFTLHQWGRWSESIPYGDLPSTRTLTRRWLEWRVFERTGNKRDSSIKTISWWMRVRWPGTPSWSHRGKLRIIVRSRIKGKPKLVNFILINSNLLYYRKATALAIIEMRNWMCTRNLLEDFHKRPDLTTIVIITAWKRGLGQANAFTGVCLSTRGVSVWCHFLSGCLVPYSFQGSLCLVPCSFQGVYVQGVCVQMGVSVQKGDFCPGWVSVQWGLCPGRPPRQRPPHGEERAVHILLECFLVVNTN